MVIGGLITGDIAASAGLCYTVQCMNARNDLLESGLQRGSGRGPDPLPPGNGPGGGPARHVHRENSLSTDWLGCGGGDAQDDGLQAAEALGEARVS